MVDAGIATALEEFGRLDVVVSNAMIFTSVAFDELSEQDWRSVLQVHLAGGFYLAQPAYQVMKKQGYGRFVFISSSAGAEEIAGHLAEVSATEPFTVPGSIFDEVFAMCNRLGVSAVG